MPTASPLPPGPGTQLALVLEYAKQHSPITASQVNKALEGKIIKYGASRILLYLASRRLLKREKTHDGLSLFHYTPDPVTLANELIKQSTDVESPKVEIKNDDNVSPEVTKILHNIMSTLRSIDNISTITFNLTTGEVTTTLSITQSFTIKD